MLLAAPADYRFVEPAHGAEAFDEEQIRRQIAQRPLDPLADRNREARLGPLEQSLGGLAVEQASQDMLPLAAPDFHAERNGRGIFGDSVIEERDATLEAHRHRGAVDLAEDVVGQI